MRGNELLDKMGLVDPKFVEAADTLPQRRSVIWVKWAALAACLGLVIAGLAVHGMPDPVDTPDLPMLSVGEMTDGMGYEGYMAYGIEELVNANPWDENVKLTTLPVYRNVCPSDSAGEIADQNPPDMGDFIAEVTDKLGNLAEYAEITSDDASTVGVYFESGIVLPEQYNFSYYASYEEINAVAQYLLDEFSDLIDMDVPVINIHGGDRDINTNQRFRISFYEGAGSLTEQIVNYHFNTVSFSCDLEGKLWIIRITRTDLTDFVGDYPVISLKEAKRLLRCGSYITSVPYALNGKEKIAKVELVYRNSQMEQYYMPYYRFYIEITEEALENGLKSYGTYYVPAIPARYLTNMPTWDGRFN